MQRGVQPLLAAAECGEVHLFQRGPECGIVGSGRCHPQVGTDRSLKDCRIVRHDRQGAQAALFPERLHRHTAQRHAARVSGAGTGQNGRNGAFAAAGLAHQ